MTDDRVPAIVIGVIFSIINAVVTVYLALKTGMADGIFLLLLFLSFFLFAITRNVVPRTFVYMMTIMMSSTAAVIAYTDGLGAIIISGAPFAVPDYIMMILLSLSGIIGMLMSFYFVDYFLKGGFPWPMSKVMASVVGLLSAAKKDATFKTSTIRMTVAGAVSGTFSFVRSLGAFPETLGSTVAGIGLSPLMIGVGLLIGFSACLQIAIGTVLSLAVFVFVEGTGVDYSAHMKSPWIFSTAISMMLTTAVISLYVIVKPMIVERHGRLKSKAESAANAARDGGRPPSGNWYRTALLIVIVAISAIMLQYYVGIPSWVFLICVPVALLFMVIETRGRAEVSMSVGISSFIIILLVGLAFGNIVPLLILEGFVLAMVMSFSLCLSMFKTAEFSGVDTGGLAWMSVIGSITGGIICIPIIKTLNGIYGIGSSALPAPYSVMWLEMATSAVTRVASPSINFYMILLGIVIAIVLYRFKISAVSVAMGLLLPVSVSATILIGGILAWIVAKKGWLKDDNGITPSGLIAGDILVTLAMSLRALL